MKYREFWISDRTFKVSEGLPSWNDGEQNIHVIEYSAYEVLLKDYGTVSAERDTLKAEVERLKKYPELENRESM